MAIADGKSRRTITLPDEVWAVVDAHMIDTQKTASEVMQQVFVSPTHLLEVRLSAQDTRLYEVEKLLKQLVDGQRSLIGLVDMLAHPCLPPVRLRWPIRLYRWLCGQPSPKLPLPQCGINSTLFVQSQLPQQPRPIAAR